MTPLTYREERMDTQAAARRRDRRDMAFFFLGCCFAGVAMRWLMAFTGGI